MSFFYCNEIILEDERVKLEPMTAVHFEKLLTITLENPDLLELSSPDIGKHLNLKEYFQIALSQRLKHQRYPFVILDKKSGKYTGSTSFNYFCKNKNEIEIGCTWIGKEYQRTGINRHSKYLLLKYAIEIIKCDKIILKTNENNILSQLAILSIGGRYEEFPQCQLVSADGRSTGLIHYRILKKEWDSLKETVFAQQKLTKFKKQSNNRNDISI